MLSNNEGRNVKNVDRNKSTRYVDTYGDATLWDEGSLNLFNDYKPRWLNLFEGMRQGFRQTAPKWANRLKFVAYNDVVHFIYGRWGAWREGKLPTHANGLLDNAQIWDGASPEYYLNHWEYTKWDNTIFSPQTEYCNVRWQLDEIYQTHPEFWYEFSLWDGVITDGDSPSTEPGSNKRLQFEERGDPWTPTRYKAWLRFGMWLTFPRVVREFRNSDATVETTGKVFFYNFLDAVEEVYRDPVLRDFWRNGTVVVNPTREHPYRSVQIVGYENKNVWHVLECDANNMPEPQHSHPLDRVVNVWALAIVKGTSPNREWLIYAHSPTQDRTGVTVTVPVYGDVTLDVPQAGVFQMVAE